MSTVLEDLPDRFNAEKASGILLWVVVAIFGAMVAWAALTQIDRTVRGMGKIIPSSQLQIVSNLEGGVVQDILVRGGQLVAAGTPLIRLDPTQSTGELGSGEASSGALIAKIARLRAEVIGREPIYPMSADPIVTGQIEIERALHSSRMAELNALIASASARVSQAQRAVTEADFAYQSRVTQRDARITEAITLRPLVERGIEPRMSLIQAESAAQAARTDASGAQAAIGRAREGVLEARAAAAGVLQQWRATAAGELAAAQAELSARQQSLPALERRVERTIVRAPVRGRINRVLVATRGSAVQPGQPLLEIVPSDDKLLVEAVMRPQDIAFVRLGQKARVSVTAYDRAIYGALDGTVVGISPDTVEREKGGESFYIVRVQTVTNAIRDPAGNRRPIGPGMVAEVDVLGDKRSVLSYILSPITQVTETAFRDK